MIFFIAVFSHFFYHLYLIYLIHIVVFIHMLFLSWFLEYNDQKAGSSCYPFQKLVECDTYWFDLVGIGLPCCTTLDIIHSVGGLREWYSLQLCDAHIGWPYTLALERMQLDLLLNWKATLHKNWCVVYLLVCFALINSALGKQGPVDFGTALSCIALNTRLCRNNTCKWEQDMEAEARWFGYSICTLPFFCLNRRIKGFLHNRVKEITLNTCKRRWI